MKRSQITTIAFIILSAITLSLLSYSGNAKLLSDYSIIVVLIAFFTGKYIGKQEVNNYDKSNV